MPLLKPDARLHVQAPWPVGAGLRHVQNLFTITSYSGVDPVASIAPDANTSSLNGIDNNIYPRSRTYSAGLNLRL